MAQNDYFVIVYQVLKYLYECLKKGEKPEACYLTASAYNIHENYWQYIILSLITEEYVKGIAVNQRWRSFRRSAGCHYHTKGYFLSVRKFVA